MKKIITITLIFLFIINITFSNGILTTKAQTNMKLANNERREILLDNNELHNKVSDKKKEKLEEEIYFDFKDESISIIEGESKELEYNFISNYFDEDELIWEISNKNVFKIDGNRIIAMEEGNSKLSVFTKDGVLKDELEIIVKPYKDKNLEIECISDNDKIQGITLDKNTSYELSNNTGSTIILKTDATYSGPKYDIIRYDSFGGISSMYKDDYGDLYIYNNQTIRISSSTGQTVIIESDSNITVSKVSYPVFYEFDIVKGKSYEFLNKTDQISKVLTTSSYNSNTYDFIRYYEGGNVESTHKDTSSGRFYLYSNQKVKITASKGDGFKCYIPYEHKDIIKEVNDPVFYEFDIQKGKNYEFLNQTEKRSEVLTTSSYNSNTYDFIRYYEGGDVAYTHKDTSDGFYLYSNQKVKITPSQGSGFRCYIPYEHKDIIKIVENPVFYNISLEKGRYYQIANNTNNYTEIITTSAYNGSKYDITCYDENLKEIYSRKEQYGNISLYKGRTISVCNVSDYDLDFYIPSEIMSGEVDRPFIESVKLGTANGLYDISTKVHNIQKSSKEVRNIKVSVNWNGEEAKEVRLQQGGKYITSTDGIFKFIPGEVFNTGDDIYAVAISKSGKKSAAVNIKMNIVDNYNSIEENGSLSLGGYTVGNAPSDVPAIGDMNLDLSLGYIKFTAKYDEKKDTVKYILGNSTPISLNDFDKKFAEAQLAAEVSKVIGEPIGYSIGKEWSPKVSASGYMECRSVDGELKVISGGLTLSGGLATSMGTQLAVGPIPVYIKLGVGADVGMNIDIFKNAPITMGSLNLSGKFYIEPSLTPEAGVGINSVASVGVKGKLSVNIAVESMKNNADVKFKGVGSVTATLLMFSGEIPFFEYPKRKYLSNNFNLYDASTYSEISRDYTYETSEWLGSKSNISTLNENGYSNEEIDVLQTGIFPNSTAKIIKSGDKKIVLWIRDNLSRTSINRTELVYSIYDEERNIWGEPKAVYDDGTIDFYQQVAFDDDNVFVIWQNVKSVIENNDSGIEDICKDSEIMVSKFNKETNTFEEPVLLSNNNIYDGNPIITTSNGKAFATWVSNSENNIFGNTGVNNIMYSEFDGYDWSEAKTLVKNTKSVVSMDSIYYGNSAYVAYGVNTTDDLSNINSQEIYYTKVTNGKVNSNYRLTNNDVIDCNPVLINNSKTVGLYYYSDGKILYKNDITSDNATSILNSSNELFNDRFQVINNGGEKTILWIENIDDSYEVFGAIHNDSDSELVNKIRITNSNKRIKDIDVVFNSDGKLLIASNTAEKILTSEDGIDYYKDGTSSLCISTVEFGQDLSISNVTIDDTYFNINEANNIKLTIENKGQLNVDKFKIEVYEKNSDGDFILSNSDIFIEKLKSGESIDIDTDFIPKEVKQYELMIKVVVDNGIDIYEENNYVTLEYGYSDLAISSTFISEIEDDQYINIELTNNSSISSGNGKLRIKENDVNGEVLYETSIESLSHGDINKVMYKIDESTIRYEDGEKLLYIEIGDSNNEKYKYNNNESIIIKRKYLREDINKDGVIDIIDLSNIALKYNESLDSKEWDYKYDLNRDSIIDIFDLANISTKL